MVIFYFTLYYKKKVHKYGKNAFKKRFNTFIIQNYT